MQAWALRYAANGFYVVPLHEPLFKHPLGYTCTCEEYRHSDKCKNNPMHKHLYLEPDQHCPSAGKHPRVKDWEAAATVDPAQIDAWWREWPTANIAIAAGKSGIVTLDADTYKEDFAGDKLLTRQDEATVTTLTGGGGAHLWYKMPEGKTWTNARGTLPKGIDVRAHGGLVVVVPSLHASGRRYQFELGYSLGEIDIASCPTWLTDILDAAAAKQMRYTSANGNRWNGTPTTEPVNLAQFSLPANILALIARPPAKGQRSEADMRVVVALCHAGASDDDIRAVFEHNPIGVAGKFAERGLDYLARTVLNARHYTETHPSQAATRELLQNLRLKLRSMSFADLVPEEMQSAKGYRTNETDRIVADAALSILADYGAMQGRVSKLELSVRTGKSPNTCRSAMARLCWLFDTDCAAGSGTAPVYSVKKELRTLTRYNRASVKTCQGTQPPIATHAAHDAFVRSMTNVTQTDLEERNNQRAADEMPPMKMTKELIRRLAADIPSAGPAVLLAVDALAIHGALTRKELAAVLHKTKYSISRLVQRGLLLGIFIENGNRIDIVDDWRKLVDDLAPSMPTTGTVHKRKIAAADSRIRYCSAALKNGNLASDERQALHRRLERAAKMKQDIARKEAPDLPHERADVPALSAHDHLVMCRLAERRAQARMDIAENARADQWRLIAEIQRLRIKDTPKREAWRMLELAGWERREVSAAMVTAWPATAVEVAI